MLGRMLWGMLSGGMLVKIMHRRLFGRMLRRVFGECSAERPDLARDMRLVLFVLTGCDSKNIKKHRSCSAPRAAATNR